MKSVVKIHLPAIVAVTIILGALFFVTERRGQSNAPQLSPEQQRLVNIPGLDLENSFDRALLQDALNLFEPQRKEAHEELLRTVERIRAQQIEALSNQNPELHPLNGARLWRLFLMYLRFVVIYALVMLITYYGVQTLAVLRFVIEQQNRPGHLELFLALIRRRPALRTTQEWLRYLSHLLAIPGKLLVKGALYLILFAPAYVVAYSFKTNFETGSDLFMILLAVLSNGLLINYTNKFYSLLTAESRKGYVETARVKNLNDSYDFNDPAGVTVKQIFRVHKNFSGHILQHIYQNAAFQYLTTMKEQASFLITGLMIIEMALNIHQHLSYELLKQLLYKNYPEVILMVLGIFYLVKATDIFADWAKERKTRNDRG